ncbi:MAG: CxxC-x17-CxxC domain-containing protein [Candidatus Aenigmatarchaeota archaeon]
MFYKRPRSRRGRTHRLIKRLKKAKCDVCGAGTRVPFTPEGVKPVYCERCLERIRKEKRIKRGLERPDDSQER